MVGMTDQGKQMANEQCNRRLAWNVMGVGENKTGVKVVELWLRGEQWPRSGSRSHHPVRPL